MKGIEEVLEILASEYEKVEQTKAEVLPLKKGKALGASKMEEFLGCIPEHPEPATQAEANRQSGRSDFCHNCCAGSSTHASILTLERLRCAKVTTVESTAKCLVQFRAHVMIPSFRSGILSRTSTPTKHSPE